MFLLHLSHHLSVAALAALLILIATVYAIGLMLSTRLLYGVDRLSLNNEVAGFKFAVIGVFYAVLLAFVVVAVWEEFRQTESAVRDEAKAAVDLYRVTLALPDNLGAEIRKPLITYITDVPQYEWPTMGLGLPSDVVVKDLDQLSKAILNVSPGTQQQLALYQEALRLLARITDNRTERLDSADGSMPGILWFVLIFGSLITLGYPAFFGSTNVGAQVLMTASLAILVALALLLGIAFDYPFTGDVHISPFPFAQALQQMPLI
jgi:ABC-type multidrug transport system fused ATPase/permease subunit